MHSPLPNDYRLALDWNWSNWQPYYQALVDTSVSANNIHTWLQVWDAVARMNSEIRWRLNVESDLDTTDEQAEAKFQNFVETIVPETEKMTFELNKKLVASGLAPESIKIPLRWIEAKIRLFREANLPLLAKLNDLGIQYGKLRGGQTVLWEGQEITLEQISPVLTEPDRQRRKQAWLLIQERVAQDRDQFDAIWREMMLVRKQIYQNAGLDNYTEYRWLELGRFDYTLQDAVSFTEAIAETVVPAAQRLREKARTQFGYDTLRPWDVGLFSHGIEVDIQGRAPLKPFNSMDELINKAGAVFNQVDTELGTFFRTMQEEGLLDLDNRKGKAPSGYCTLFAHSKHPFIFMNAVGTADDVATLLHEAGHAFHWFFMSELEYFCQWDMDLIPTEFAEVGSMAMELLAAPHLTEDKGGYFNQADYIRYRADHLRSIVFALPYMAVVTAFQHWIYANHDIAADPANCDAKWMELWQRHIPGVDWTGYEDHITNRWRLQGHIFGVPHYYIEYALAQLGAIQVWANSLRDPQVALAAYKRALRLGNTAALPELFATAGAKLAFDGGTLQQTIDLIERTLAELEL